MNRILVVFLAVILAMLPYAAPVNAKTPRSGYPPIEQPLVREGDFAVKLANSLNLTGSNDEAAAEDALSSISISPGNGWISDYPVTPDIIAEVRGSTARAAAAGSLQMPEAEAAGIVDRVGIDMKLPVIVANDTETQVTVQGAGQAAAEDYSYKQGPDGSNSSSYSSSYSSSSSGQYGEAPPPPDAGLYDAPPGYVEEYYDENGPPVVTYYPPPWEYYWLYDWVPWPFWWEGFGFGGFFVLCDFDKHHHHHHCSNHYRNANGTYGRVDPANRRNSGTSVSSRTAGTKNSGSRLNSANARAGAAAIVNRSIVRSNANAANSATGSRVSGTQTAGASVRKSQGAGRLATNSASRPRVSTRRGSMSSNSRISRSAGPRGLGGAPSSRGLGGHHGGIGGGQGGGGAGHR
jgi:hypothetical protein